MSRISNTGQSGAVLSEHLATVFASSRSSLFKSLSLARAPVAATGWIVGTMEIKKPDRHEADALRSQRLMAAGGLLGALAASSCCVLPLVLFSLGVSGAWIGNFTQLAPYQPYFLGATAGFLGYGYWLVYRSSKLACADGETCARPLPNRFVKAGLVLATILVTVALGFDFLAPLFLNS
jgi:mercuric ion transport protein